MSGEKRAYGGPEGPYRTAAEIEKEVKLTQFQKFVDWWKDEEHYIPFIVIAVVVGFIGGCLTDVIISGSRIRNHGILICEKNYYVKTENPAVGLTKIICLSANGEEKNVYEETNK